MNEQPANQNMDINALAKLFAQQSEEQKQAELARQQRESNVALGSAGIQAGASLLGGLLGQAAQRQQLQRQIQSEGERAASASQAEALVRSQQQQQDALSRLMASYRSALIR